MQSTREAEDHLRRSGRRMAALVDAIGPCGLTYTPPTFESLARSIVYQQISIRAARSIYQRLLAECAAEGGLDARLVLDRSAETLRTYGLSAQKATYLRELARHAHTGSLDFNLLPNLPDHEVIAQLTQVKGIGIWTAQMFLIFSLRRPDVLPGGDLGIRNAVKRLYRLREVPKPAEIEKRGAKWRPYASVASWYLWRSLEPSGPF